MSGKHMMGGTPDAAALGQFMRGMSIGKDNKYDYAAKLFGQPSNPNPQRQMHLDEVQDRQLPYYLEGRSTTLESIITGIGYISPVFETKYLLPYREIDTIAFNWNEMHFNTDIATAVPHRGQSRMLTFTQKSYQASSVRRGLAIMAEHDRLTTQEGVRDYLLQIASLANSIEETAASDVMHTLFAFGYANYVHETAEGFQGVPLSVLIAHERDQFAIMQKDQDQFQNMVNRYCDIVKQNSGDRPDILVIPTGTRAFLAHGDPVKTTYWFRGPGRIDPEQVDGPEAYTSIQGLLTFEMRPSQAYQDYVNSTDLSTRSVSIGEFYMISNPYINQNGTTMEDFKTDQYNATVYSFDHNRDRPLSVRDAVQFCGRFEWSKRDQGAPPTRDGHANLIGRRNADIPPEYQSYFNAQYYVPDAATFYNKKENRGAVTMHLGDIEINEESWHFEDTRAFAEILANRIRTDSKSTDFVSTWNTTMDMLQQIESAQPTKDYIEELQEAAKKGEKYTPDDLVAAYGGHKWRETGYNDSTGTLDLPGQDNNQRGVDYPAYPAFFANWPGLNAIAEQKPGGRFASLQPKASSFVRMWNSITGAISSAMPNSIFINTSHRPVNMPKVEAACTLFHSLVLPPRMPLFLRAELGGEAAPRTENAGSSIGAFAVDANEERAIQSLLSTGAMAGGGSDYEKITVFNYDNNALRDLKDIKQEDKTKILDIARVAIAGFRHMAAETGADKKIREEGNNTLKRSEAARYNAIVGSAVIRAAAALVNHGDGAKFKAMFNNAMAARANEAAAADMATFVKDAVRRYSGSFTFNSNKDTKELLEMTTKTLSGKEAFYRSPLTLSPANLKNIDEFFDDVRPPNGLVDNEFAAESKEQTKTIIGNASNIPAMKAVSAHMTSPGEVRDLEHLHFVQHLKMRMARRSNVRNRAAAGQQNFGSGMEPAGKRIQPGRNQAAFAVYAADSGLEANTAQATDFFRKVTNPNFTERMQEAERIPDWLTRTIAVTMLGCQYNGETLDALMKNNIPIPYSFIAVRLNMTFRVSSAIVMISGIKGNTGFLAIRGVNFQISHDANTKYMFGNLTLYMKAICAKRRNVAHMDNIVIKGYDGGGGVLPYHTRKQWISEQGDRYASTFQSQGDDTASVFYFMLPYRAADNMEVVIDVTGRWQYDHYQAIETGADNRLQWTGAGFYAMHWKWFDKMTNAGYVNVQEIESYYNNRSGRQNTIAIKGYHRRYDTGARSHTAEEHGMGHLGPYCGPGLVDVCNTLSKMFPSNPRTFTNMRAGVRGY